MLVGLFSVQSMTFDYLTTVYKHNDVTSRIYALYIYIYIYVYTYKPIMAAYRTYHHGNQR